MDSKQAQADLDEIGVTTHPSETATAKASRVRKAAADRCGVELDFEWIEDIPLFGLKRRGPVRARKLLRKRARRNTIVLVPVMVNAGGTIWMMPMPAASQPARQPAEPDPPMESGASWGKSILEDVWHAKRGLP